MSKLLVLKPIEAILSHNTSIFTGTDPYCTLIYGTKKATSDICYNGGTHPYWEETLALEVDSELQCLIKVKDKVMLLPDLTIGTVELDLQEVESQGIISKWFPIINHKKQAGEILLEIYFANQENTYTKKTQASPSTEFSATDMVQQQDFLKDAKPHNSPENLAPTIDTLDNTHHDSEEKDVLPDRSQDIHSLDNLSSDKEASENYDSNNDEDKADANIVKEAVIVEENNKIDPITIESVEQNTLDNDIKTHFYGPDCLETDTAMKQEGLDIPNQAETLTYDDEITPDISDDIKQDVPVNKEDTIDIFKLTSPDYEERTQQVCDFTLPSREKIKEPVVIEDLLEGVAQLFEEIDSGTILQDKERKTEDLDQINLAEIFVSREESQAKSDEDQEERDSDDVDEISRSSQIEENTPDVLNTNEHLSEYNNEGTTDAIQQENVERSDAEENALYQSNTPVEKLDLIFILTEPEQIYEETYKVSQKLDEEKILSPDNILENLQSSTNLNESCIEEEIPTGQMWGIYDLDIFNLTLRDVPGYNYEKPLNFVDDREDLMFI